MARDTKAPARLQVRKSVYRDEDGWLITGTDTSGTRVQIFELDRAIAETMRDRIKAGFDPYLGSGRLPKEGGTDMARGKKKAVTDMLDEVVVYAGVPVRYSTVVRHMDETAQKTAESAGRDDWLPIRDAGLMGFAQRRAQHPDQLPEDVEPLTYEEFKQVADTPPGTQLHPEVYQKWATMHPEPTRSWLLGHATTSAPAFAKVTADPRREPWLMTRRDVLAKAEKDATNKDLMTGTYFKRVRAFHERQVKKALAEGKPVPPEVLRDYPDLVARASAAAMPETEAVAPAAKEPAEQALLAHLVERTTQKESSELFLRKTFGDSAYESLHQQGLISRTAHPSPSKNITSITLNGRKALRTTPQVNGKTPNMYTLGKAILSEDMTIGEWWLAKTPKQELKAAFGDRVLKNSVEKALAEGKSVPPEVLADYPGLVARAPAAAVPETKAAPVMPTKPAAEAVLERLGRGGDATRIDPSIAKLARDKAVSNLGTDATEAAIRQQAWTHYVIAKKADPRASMKDLYAFYAKAAAVPETRAVPPVARALAAAEAKAPWQMTKQEVFEKAKALLTPGAEGRPFTAERTALLNKQVVYHKTLVQQALSEDKPVPAEVLADYPDLVAKAPVAAVPVAERLIDIPWGSKANQALLKDKAPLSEIEARANYYRKQEQKWREAADEVAATEGGEKKFAYGMEQSRAFGATAKALEDLLPTEAVPDLVTRAPVVAVPETEAAPPVAEPGISRRVRDAHDARTSRSRTSDERQEHSLVIGPDDPRVERWKRDPGRMDVRGVDTPAKRKRAKSRRTPASASTRVQGVG